MPILKVRAVEFDLYCECGKELECEVKSPGRWRGKSFFESQKIEAHPCPDYLEKAKVEGNAEREDEEAT